MTLITSKPTAAADARSVCDNKMSFWLHPRSTFVAHCHNFQRLSGSQVSISIHAKQAEDAALFKTPQGSAGVWASLLFAESLPFNVKRVEEQRRRGLSSEERFSFTRWQQQRRDSDKADRRTDGRTEALACCRGVCQESRSSSTVDECCRHRRIRSHSNSTCSQTISTTVGGHTASVGVVMHHCDMWYMYLTVLTQVKVKLNGWFISAKHAQPSPGDELPTTCLQLLDRINRIWSKKWKEFTPTNQHI